MMKKNRRLTFFRGLLVSVVAFIIVLCIHEFDLTNFVKKNSGIKKTIITFTVPDICKIDENKLKKFNTELNKDGYNYELEIIYLEYEKYAEDLETTLKKGNTDVAFLGLGDGSESSRMFSLINAGLVLNLDDILTEESGMKLYNAFPTKLWESVKCNNHIYSIPSAVVNDQGIYAAFNRRYIADDDIEAWDGSIEGIYEILKKTEWNDGNGDTPRFQYLVSDDSFDDMINCEVKYGVLYDYDTLSVENALKSEKYLNYLKALEQMKKEGYLSEEKQNMSNPQLISTNYLVALATGPVDDVFINDSIKIKTVSPYLSSRINGSIILSEKSNCVEQVVDFLGILYSEEKYGNILLYGQEGDDYKLVDGVACNMDGSPLEDDFIDKLCLDLFINVFPVEGENYMNNRKEEFFSFYDRIELSPFIGFEPDSTELEAVKRQWEEYKQ